MRWLVTRRGSDAGLILLVESRVMNSNRNKKLTVPLAGVLVVLLVQFTYAIGKDQDDQFLNEIRHDIQPEPEYFMLCNMHAQAIPGNCDVADASSGGRLTSLIHSMQLAKPSTHPTKVPKAQERMLIIGRGKPILKQYVGCYRLIQFVGFEETYLNRVKAAPECAHVVRYDVEYVSLPEARKWLPQPVSNPSNK